MGKIEEMVRGLVDEACGKIMTRIGNKGREIEGEFSSLHKDLDTLKHYRVVSVDGRKVYPVECHNDGINLHEDDDYYDFTSNHDILVGDYIRVYDDTYHMGMAVVVGRVYDWNKNVVILQCRSCDERNDYVFTDEFVGKCEGYVKRKKESIKTDNDRDKFELCNKLYDLYARNRTTVDYWNAINRIKEIVFPLLGLEYHRPERWEFE